MRYLKAGATALAMVLAIVFGVSAPAQAWSGGGCSSWRTHDAVQYQACTTVSSGLVRHEFKVKNLLDYSRYITVDGERQIGYPVSDYFQCGGATGSQLFSAFQQKSYVCNTALSAGIYYRTIGVAYGSTVTYDVALSPWLIG